MLLWLEMTVVVRDSDGVEKKRGGGGDEGGKTE